MGEDRILRLSAAAALALGLLGLGAAWASNSRAILLDGLYNIAFFFTALFTLRVARLLTQPDDARYPFGYLYFEPLINTVKGLLILGVSLYAFVDAAVALLQGGRELSLGPSLAYAVVATVSCALILFAVRRFAGVAASPLVEADIDNWTVNTFVSAGVFLGFCTAALVTRAGYPEIARLVDPALVAIVVLVSVSVPVRMAAEGLQALLNRAAPGRVVEGMRAEVAAVLAGLPVRALFVRAVQPGRTPYVLVHVLVAEGVALDLAEADLRRRAIIDALVSRHSPIVVDVVFTAVEAFAAPSVGFRADASAG